MRNSKSSLAMALDDFLLRQHHIEWYSGLDDHIEHLAGYGSLCIQAEEYLTWTTGEQAICCREWESGFLFSSTILLKSRSFSYDW
jgi:hypothetical protein